jgi:hypothetical protein
MVAGLHGSIVMPCVIAVAFESNGTPGGLMFTNMPGVSAGAVAGSSVLAPSAHFGGSNGTRPPEPPLAVPAFIVVPPDPAAPPLLVPAVVAPPAPPVLVPAKPPLLAVPAALGVAPPLELVAPVAGDAGLEPSPQP